MYLDALKDFPGQDTKLHTEKGVAFCQKSDIFKETLWFSYKNDPSNWHVLSKERVQEILEKNKKKETVASLEQYVVETIAEEKLVFENVVGQDSLNRFDRPKRKKNNKNKNNKNRNKKRRRNKQNAPKNS